MPATVPVLDHISNANDQLASLNRARMEASQVLGLHLMASPGAGKTSLIERLVPLLCRQRCVGVVEGDIATRLDADRVAATGATTVQVNTDGACHLDASMLNRALDRVNLPALDYLFVENVGNLICSVEHGLGTHYSVLVASVPEGDDKPLKYPAIFRAADMVLLNKVDLLPYVPFDLDRFLHGVRNVNEGVVVRQVSCTTGEGIQGVADWLADRHAAHCRER